MLGQLKSQGTREGEIGEAKTQRPNKGKQRPRKRASSGETGKGGESHRRWGEDHGGDSAERPPRADAGKKEETTSKRGKQRAAGADPPRPSPLDFGVAVVTASKGQGRGERVGLGWRAGRGLPLYSRGTKVWGSAWVGARRLGGASSAHVPWSPRVDWGRQEGESLPFRPSPLLPSTEKDMR